ncbi:DUF6274 family protein [Streptomyces sp. NPDC058220]|uniref:DUF6274 family protein n=1 Tax=unclassified Streptomyces TaxID=2593676 RepID=UPI003652B236
MTTSTTKHETRALLRAHLAAASGHPHRTGFCPVCHRLQRLVMDPASAEDDFSDDELPDGQSPSSS